MILMMLCAAILLALCFPETRSGRVARLIFVNRPADWLNALTLRRSVGGVVLGVIFMAALFVFPIEFALIAAGDITAYVEVVAAMVVIVARVPLKRMMSRMVSSIRALGHRLRKPAQRIRAKRRTGRPLSRRDSNDSEPGWAFA